MTAREPSLRFHKISIGKQLHAEDFKFVIGNYTICLRQRVKIQYKVKI